MTASTTAKSLAKHLLPFHGTSVHVHVTPFGRLPSDLAAEARQAGNTSDDTRRMSKPSLSVGRVA